LCGRVERCQIILLKALIIIAMVRAFCVFIMPSWSVIRKFHRGVDSSFASDNILTLNCFNYRQF
ncbi:MAG: hypothetical protein KAS28_00830, partial [Desulfobacula sp.]|nr:hypothetical protein [Desulfobacula sp.]